MSAICGYYKAAVTNIAFRLRLLCEHSGSPLIDAATTFIAPKFTAMYMVMTIIPSAISVAVVRRTVGTVAVAPSIMSSALVSGHSCTCTRKNSGESTEETQLRRRRFRDKLFGEVSHLFKRFYLDLFLLVFFLFTQVFRQQNTSLLAYLDDDFIVNHTI